MKHSGIEDSRSYHSRSVLSIWCGCGVRVRVSAAARASSVSMFGRWVRARVYSSRLPIGRPATPAFGLYGCVPGAYPCCSRHSDC